MTNEEKALEIKHNDPCCVWNNGCPNVYNAALEMAKWKDEHPNEAWLDKACEWLADNLLHYWGQINANDTDEFIDNFRKAMEE